MDHIPKIAEPEARAKPFSCPNGALRKHHHHRPPPPPPEESRYRECLKNHAANLGGHALDGCGEFMLSPAADPADPSSLCCAACGCHRNFHRRLPNPLRRRHRDRVGERDGNGHEDGEGDDEEEEDEEETGMDRAGPQRSWASSPPFYSSAPHMLLALGAGFQAGPGPIPVRPVAAPIVAVAAAPVAAGGAPAAEAAQPRKRFRTKFTPEQKERMQELSERLGWRMQKRDEGLVEECCGEIGVDRVVFKVWMHNNKHAFFGRARRGEPGGDQGGSGAGGGSGGVSVDGVDVSAAEGSGHSANGVDNDGGGNGHAVDGSPSSS